jgi:hypothetical protein
VLQTEADRLTAELESARSLAALDFNREQARYRIERPLLTLAGTGLLLLVLLSLLGVLARVVRPGPAGLTPDSALLLRAVAGLLFILFAYQAFEMAGAAFAGVVVLLLLMAWMPGRGDGARGAQG